MTARQAWLIEEMALPLQPGFLEEQGYAKGFKCIAGLDEAGRGPWAGPVVAAAVIFPRGINHSDIKDSKLLKAKERDNLAPWIKAQALSWGVGIVSAEEIDRINILNASLLAMARALKQLRPLPDYLLIDGPHAIPFNYLEGMRQQATGGSSNPDASSRKPQAFPFQRTIRKGDRLCLTIAAASILAKVARDRLMLEYDRLYPQYGFAQHKGYRSPVHLDALKRYGPSPIHRRSFGPVRRRLGKLAKATASLFRSE